MYFGNPISCSIWEDLKVGFACIFVTAQTDLGLVWLWVLLFLFVNKKYPVVSRIGVDTWSPICVLVLFLFSVTLIW